MPRPPRRRPRPMAATVGVAATVMLLPGCADSGGATGLVGALGGILVGIEDLGGGGGRATVAYDCDDGRELTVTFSGDRDQVRVEAEDEDGDEETYELELAGRRDDRRLYTDDDDEVRLVVFGDDGGEAELDVEDGADFEDCDRES